MVAAKGKPIARNCSARAAMLQQARLPGVVGKVRSLVAAEARWISAGRPTRPPESVKKIFETICMPCEYFQAQGQSDGTCGLCGCRLKQTGGMLNKIAMATESCPAGKWPAATA